MDAAAGFWIFLAAIVVAGIWKETREKAQKNETLRLIVEKTGTIDEAKLKELFGEPLSGIDKPGTGYRVARVAGTITMFVGAAIATFSGIVVGLGDLLGHTRIFDDGTWVVAAFAVPSGVAILGLGIFLSSRFCEPPER